jgi:hypothetical protein
MLARHAGASRFAYHQCLRLVTNALAAQQADPHVEVPWSGFDLINAFNRWKRSESAGRVFVAAPDGTITKRVTVLGWRQEAAAQVFEEAAVDLGRGLMACAQAKSGNRKGGPVGFPKWKRKGRCRDSFRLRNKHGRGGTFSIRVGVSHPRSVTLPSIGTVRVHDQTRQLRRLLRPVAHLDQGNGQPVVAPRARILFATMSRHGSRWYADLPRSPWWPLRTGPRSAASERPRRCRPASSPCGDGHALFPGPRFVLATGRRQSVACPGSTLVSPTGVATSSTRSPASSSRPTTGSVWRTSPLPTS